MFNGDVITGDPDRAPRAQDKKKGPLEEIMNIYGVCCDVSGGGGIGSTETKKERPGSCVMTVARALMNT